jgi:DNA repair exonuclease SbcCD nuclease subunit
VKLAHIADAHLGIRQYYRQTPAGINQREADVAQAFRAAIDGAIAARPDVVVVAGDLFHSVRPTNAAIVFAFRQFQHLREALPGTPVILIAGNHDTPRSAETGSILRLFEELGVDVATDEARRLVYPALDLMVLAVPHQALASVERPSLRPAGDERFRVLLLHGEVENVYPGDRAGSDYGGAQIAARELSPKDWTYIALGDYHVQYQVDERVWYAGALEYVSPNFWGDLRRERELGVRGKGWLLVDLESGKVERQLVPKSREVLDLDYIEAEGLSAPALDALIAERIEKIRGGIEGKIVRLKVYNVPRHIARELDHTTIRAYKAAALHFRLDLRRPEARRTVGIGSPGRRQTLPELVRSYLEQRSLPAQIDREEFVRAGTELVEVAEPDLATT